MSTSHNQDDNFAQNVQVKEMIEVDDKSEDHHFKKIEHPSTLKKSDLKIVREDLKIPNSRCFLLHGLLSDDECNHFLNQMQQVGFSDMSAEYPPEYRSNSRTLVLSNELADCLYARIEKHFTRRDLIRIRPICFGNEGNWLPTRLNECFKFGKYESGQNFKPHIDGPWVPRHDESSIYTVVIYLNDNFEGGKTNFLETSDERLMNLSTDTPSNDKIVCQVKPKAGTALIFNHDILHEGEGVLSGTKYIIRSEIMFRKMDDDYVVHKEEYKQNEDYIKAVFSLYQIKRSSQGQGFQRIH